MVKIAICDDNKNVCEYINDIIVDMNIVSEIEIFYSGEFMIKHLQDGSCFDIIFLDIEMDKLNGIEVGHIIRDCFDDYITKIIYISGKDNYDRQLFDVQPFLFLSKPISKERVVDAINKIIKILDKENKYFEFKICQDRYKIAFKDIIYFEIIGREIKIVTPNKNFIFYSQLKSIENLLPDMFIKTHRSFILNYNHIILFKYDEMKMSNGDIIPISQNRRKDIRNFQIKYEKKRMK